MKQGEQGFTLIEMIVVLAILALTTAMVMPIAQRSAEGQEFNTFSQALVGQLREARLQAISQNREAVLTLDFKRQIAVISQTGRELDLPGGLTIKAKTARGDVSGDTAAFRFFPDGGATGGTISLVAGNEKREITVNWLTGAIAMHDLPKP